MASLSEELSWDAPVSPACFEPGADWADAIIPHWGYLVSWADQIRHDAIARSQWETLVKRLDDAPEPRSAEEANDLFRRIAGGVWIMLSAYEERRRRAAAATFLQRLGVAV